MALWEAFISGITNPDDQSYVLSQALRFGFFQKSDGWNVEPKPVGSSLTSLDEIRLYDYKHRIKPLETLVMPEVLEVVFGKMPKRTSFPNIDINEILDQEEEVSLEEFAEIQKTYNELEKVSHALEKLVGRGCPVNSTPAE